MRLLLVALHLRHFKVGLFFYGTLLDVEVRTAVLAHPTKDVDTIPATLNGYQAFYVAEKSYPGLLQKDGGQVSGLAFKNLSDSDINKLIVFEGQDYSLDPVSIITDDDEVISARVFIPGPAIQLSSKPWTLTEWAPLHKATFLEHTNPGDVFPHV